MIYKSIVVNKINRLTSRHEFKLKPVNGKVKPSIRVSKVKYVLNKYKNVYFWVKKYHIIIVYRALASTYNTVMGSCLTVRF